MDPYVHLSITALDDKKLFITMTVIVYTPEEFQLHCINVHEGKRKLFRNSTEVRCFSCVPWGNHKVARDFERVGMLISKT